MRRSLKHGHEFKSRKTKYAWSVVEKDHKIYSEYKEAEWRKRNSWPELVPMESNATLL